MNSIETLVSIKDLSAVDRAELQRYVTGKFEEASSNEYTKLGEPATLILILVLSYAAIGGFAAWLLKRRSKESFTFRGSLRRSDGTVSNFEIAYAKSDSQPPDESVLRQLAEVTRLDPKLLHEAMETAGAH